MNTANRIGRLRAALRAIAFSLDDRELRLAAREELEADDAAADLVASHPAEMMEAEVQTARPVVGLPCKDLQTALPGCHCEACDPIIVDLVNFQSTNMRMIVCAICGNKRCPHATDHRNACTNSNEPGQKGSSWENYTAAREARVEPSERSQPDALEKIISDYVSDYEMTDGDSGCGYSPTDGERDMLKDAIMGLLADPEWDAAWGAHIAAIAASEALSGSARSDEKAPTSGSPVSAGSTAMEVLRDDALSMAMRLYGESDDTFAPETREVMTRWRPIVLAKLGGES